MFQRRFMFSFGKKAVEVAVVKTLVSATKTQVAVVAGVATVGVVGSEVYTNKDLSEAAKEKSDYKEEQAVIFKEDGMPENSRHQANEAHWTRLDEKHRPGGGRIMDGLTTALHKVLPSTTYAKHVVDRDKSIEESSTAAEAERKHRNHEQALDRELIEKGVEAQWVKTQAIQEYQLYTKMDRQQHEDVMRMDAQRHKEFEALPRAQRLNERALSVGNAVASTPVGNSTLGAIAIDQGAEHIMRETSRRGNYMTRVQYDHPPFGGPKDAPKDASFEEISESLKAYFEDGESRAKKPLLPEKLSIIRTHRVNKAFLEALDTLQEENKRAQEAFGGGTNFFPDENNGGPRGGSDS
ncbi:MAG: hypothetical protein M1812_008511 [Candelaria pacifica]|nr:MAG: hypothetical protein M1812_008511 [Candelaria pacifica]